MFSKSIRTMTMVFGIATVIVAQTGGSYDLSHNMIASGGGSSSTGGTFSVDGTAGQAIAGIQSNGSTLSVRSGFWVPHQFAPTAAGISVSGQVLSAAGGGIRNVIVTLTNAATGEIRTSRSSTFGNYRFDDVPVGHVYMLSVTSKRYTFDPAFRVLIIRDEITEENFTALPE